MAKAIKQFRFYGDENVEKNQPQDATLRNYQNGSVFAAYFPILQLGIQTLPGTIFYLNNGEYPIMVGRSGIYELELDNDTEIYNLTFEEESLEIINNSSQGYLIIDVIYDNKEV